MSTFRIYCLSFFILIIFSLSGCEKEAGDILIPAQESEYQGNYTFSIRGDCQAEKSISVNERGFFAFYIQLYDNQNISLFPVVITGEISDDGTLTGNVYRFGDELGVLSGQVSSGSFSFSYSGMNYNGNYSMIGGDFK